MRILRTYQVDSRGKGVVRDISFPTKNEMLRRIASMGENAGSICRLPGTNVTTVQIVSPK